MKYSASRPPVLSANLGNNIGFTPQMNIIKHDGTVETLTSINMSQINSTSMWIYKVGDNLTLPTDYTEYIYYISAPTGEVIENGRFTIEDDNLTLVDAITSPQLVIPGAVAVTGSITSTKTYPLRFIPLASDGTFISGVQEIGATPTLGPNITINFQNPLNSSYDVTGNMTLGTDEWTFDWTLGYTTPTDIVLVTIQCQSGGKNYKYTRIVEVVKPKEFNPQRVGVGSVA